MRILVTGGAGFIGSAVIRYIMDKTDDDVVNVDKLTYAGNLKNLAMVANSGRYAFEHADICNRQRMECIFQQYRPDAVIHMAAESHVDRSVWGSDNFIETNIVGTHTLLDVAREYWLKLPAYESALFRFYQVSTDEVYGDMGFDGQPAKEDSAYLPSSPYSASKAAADHLVRAWHRTYGLPVLISCSSNNYGPCQYPEKLIPLMISNALKSRALPVYGNGLQVRDWLYVDDHAEAIYRVLKNGKIGDTYNIAGDCQKKNIDVIDCLCDVLQTTLRDRNATDHRLLGNGNGFRSLIEHVCDRPGHDVRYAIDSKKIQAELGWYPRESFDTGLEKTITWYLDHGRDFYPEVF